mmetsp:Transcript_5098/g.13233  ORF Transcript_5098/g.13233 Transcript_5098/m.13233 type:complete len:273 (+) Transcript_5098:359-1177(+)
MRELDCRWREQLRGRLLLGQRRGVRHQSLPRVMPVAAPPARGLVARRRVGGHRLEQRDGPALAPALAELGEGPLRDDRVVRREALVAVAACGCVDDGQVELADDALQQSHQLVERHLLARGHGDGVVLGEVRQLPPAEGVAHVLHRDACHVGHVVLAAVKGDQPREECLRDRPRLQVQRRVQPCVRKQQPAEREPARDGGEGGDPRQVLLLHPSLPQPDDAQRHARDEREDRVGAHLAHAAHQRLGPAHIELLELLEEEVVQAPLLHLLVGQ